jgi:hypothetical protein
MDITVGEVVEIDNERRVVVSILSQSSGQIIIWQGKKNSEGACMPSVWQEWRQGIGLKGKRRGR